MNLLSLKYIPQINEYACGAAALAMIYNYYGLENFSQEDLMSRYLESEFHGSGNLMITTDNMVLDAKNRGFNASWIRVNYKNYAESINQLRSLIFSGTPVIVCQKFTDNMPLIGHFRVVVGFNDEAIFLHDPYPEIGGENMKWPIKKIMDFWQPTGGNVTGGVLIIINKSDAK